MANLHKKNKTRRTTQRLCGGFRFCWFKKKSLSGPGYTARVTLSERRQRVQAWMRRGEPSTTAFTRFTLGFQVLLLRLWEWETLIPKDTPLPQMSHFAILCTSFLPMSIYQVFLDCRS